MADPILTNPSAEQQLAQDHSQTESGLDYCFYRHDGIADDKRLEELRALTPDFQFRFWQPRSLFETPPGIEGLTYKVYSAFHRLKVFSNADYGACILEKPGTPGSHLASVFPRFFLFPFMGANDSQIGATFTSPELRGRGLAPRAILERSLSGNALAFLVCDRKDQYSFAPRGRTGGTFAGGIWHTGTKAWPFSTRGLPDDRSGLCYGCGPFR